MKIVMAENEMKRRFSVWHSIVIVMLLFEIQDFSPQRNPFSPHRIRGGLERTPNEWRLSLY